MACLKFGTITLDAVFLTRDAFRIAHTTGTAVGTGRVGIYPSSALTCLNEAGIALDLTFLARDGAIVTRMRQRIASVRANGAIIDPESIGTTLWLITVTRGFAIMAAILSDEAPLGVITIRFIGIFTGAADFGLIDAEFAIVPDVSLAMGVVIFALLDGAL